MKSIVYSKNRLLTGIAFLFITISISSGCKKTMNDGVPGINEVWIQDKAFNPNYISISSGTTITWTNKEGVAHTVTGNDGLPFDSGSIATNGTWSHTFSSVGIFPYHCTIHLSMVATVEVH
jgi:plastocyanin